MSKKKILRSDTPSINTDAFKPTGDLQTTEGVNATVTDLMERIQTDIKKLEMAKRHPKGRVKFTTALRQDVVTWLKVYAAENGGNAADVLENAVLFYMDYKKSLKG